MIKTTNSYICENCGKEHDGSYGSGRFCSYSCKQSYASHKVNIDAFKKSHNCEYCGAYILGTKSLLSHYTVCPNKNHIPGRKGNKVYNWICSICGEKLESRQKLRNHRSTHLESELKSDASISHSNTKGDFYCKFCGRHSTTKSGNTNHEKFCKSNPNREVFVGRPVSEETKRKISLTCSINKKSGGYRIGSGVGKSGWYKGFWCDSSWELAYVLYNLDHNIDFKRNTEKFPYTFEGKVHYYIPDFIENDLFIEIKGYHSEQVDAKLNDFPKEIKVLYESDMTEYLQYAREKYGDDFTSLYDK